jgi:beta-lactamase class A
MGSSIKQAIEEITTGFEGVLSFAAKDLQTGRTLLHRADRKCPTASVIKVPILVHILLLAQEGDISLDEIVVLREADKTPGTGILTQLSPGLTLTLRDCCTLMIALSDNTATNMLIDRVGIDAVNARMRSLGYAETTLFRKVFATGKPVSAANKRYGLGVTTAREMVCLLSEIHSCKIGEEVCGQLRSILGKQQYREGIPRLLPAGCKFQGKNGAIDHVRNDVGIVTAPNGHEIALAVFCQKMPRVLWTVDNPGHVMIAKVAQAVVREFLPDAFRDC